MPVWWGSMADIAALLIDAPMPWMRRVAHRLAAPVTPATAQAVLFFVDAG